MELVTTRSLIIGAQLTLRRNNPALSLIGVFVSGLPLLFISSPLIIVEDPIKYPLNPTTGLSSIKALSTITPLVLTSNAENARPEVFAFTPPVPRMVRSSNTAFAGRLLN